MSSASSEYLRTHEIVRAGAGAGKTYTLTHKVMEIAEEHLKREGRLPRLIVTTFTRKATQELRERLMILALEEKPHLIDFVNSRSQLVVSTIHGVMDLYLKRYGGRICVDPSYTVIGSAEAGKLARQTLRQVLLSDSSGTEILEQFPFNRLSSLVRRLDGLWAEYPETSYFTYEDFETIFSKKALSLARELKSVANRVKEESTKADWLTMADDFIRLANLLTSGNWGENREGALALLGAIKKGRKNAKSPPVTDQTADDAEAVLKAARSLSEPIYDPQAWRVFSASYSDFERIARQFSEAYQKSKTVKGALEISDLELQAMRCVREHPDTVQSFWKEWDHWLIDEYQDTSPFQVELLRSLSGERPSFIVGDPQQSIYLFRGARSEVFKEKEDEILSGGGSRRLLTMNRRSRPELLLFLNDFFSRLEPPFQPMDPFLEGDRKIEPDRVVATFYIGSALSEAEKSENEDAPEEAGGTDENSDAPKNYAEMRAIVSHVQQLLSSGVAPEEICVLARTNRTLADVAAFLNRNRIPTHVHAASGFYDRREVRDALSLLKFLVNPHDNFNTIELLRSPWFRIPDRALVEVTARKPESVWDALVNERSSSEELKSVSRLQRLIQETLSCGLVDTFQRALIDSGFIDFSHEHDISGRREANIWKLLARLQQEECKPGFNPLVFIAGSISDLKIEEGNAEGDAVAAVEPARVNLMTIHASKGLEFKHVILPRMEQKPKLTTNEEFTFDEDESKWAIRVPYGENHDMTASLPEKLWLERFQKQELYEHARVLYVALTRAVESVFLSWTPPVYKNSWAEMVRMDLSMGVHKEKNYSYRIISGETELPELKSVKSETVELRKKWIEDKGGDSALSLSVTDLLDRKTGLHFTTTSKTDVVNRLKVASRGTAVHRLMELLKYPSQDRLSMLVKKWFPGQDDRVLAGIEFVRQSKNPPLLEIIQNGFVEYGFTISENDSQIEGQMDLWGRTNSGDVWIIDYKTGSPEYKEKAFDQMALYAFALRKSEQIKPDEKIHLAAVYPYSEEIYIQPEPPRARIRELFGI